MASKSAGPLIIGLGAFALFASSKKKKKATSSGTTTTPDTDVYPTWDGPAPEPRPGDPSTKKPAGSPPGGSSYDADYWGSTTEERLISIREHFKFLGYNVAVDAWPMNELGPKGSVSMQNESGTTGKLGGNDDKPSAIVTQFQRNYNSVSAMNKAERVLPDSMGGLDPDGLVGPYVLNGLRYSVESIKSGATNGKSWMDLVQMAKIKGFA